MGGKNWAGRVPDNWNLVRFSKAYSFSRGLDIKKQDLSDHGLPVISYGQIHAKDNPGVRVSDRHIRYIPEEFAKEAQLGRALLEKGDIVFADTSEDIEGVGNMMRAAGGSTLYAGYHALIARPSAEFRHKYMAYQMISSRWRQQIQRSVQGVKVYSITQRIFNEVTILQPPLHEQQLIVHYLDQKTAEIDALIEKLSLQVELLERYRRELIARTVTRGLDPDAPMKDSGIEWIGDIPSHWAEASLKSMLRRVSVKNKPKRRVLSVERVNGVVDRETEGSPDNHNRLPDNLSAYLAVDRGQFAMNKMKAWRGSYGISRLDGIVSPAYYVFDLNHPNPEFFNWAIRSDAYIPFFGRDSYGIRTDQWDFKMSALRSIPFFSPPMSEQAAIVAYLEKETQVIDSTIEGINRQIELLGRYRKQVINDAVTGKVRVGEVA
ncbi:restriction endonuclease subunit S [Corynebacterium vitaeruminis]|uniref:restriction endonuclease subunit S n=1 Tax=Corynebacterium vitaeruminis TaxID=38305 RepID=UPI0009DE8B52|nr:restriction endonuclease subunit S [Corynebacterium vitaeruminis]